MIEADNDYLSSRYRNLDRETQVLRIENESLLKSIKIYQGMSSLIIANERIADALAYTVGVLERRVERE